MYASRNLFTSCSSCDVAVMWQAKQSNVNVFLHPIGTEPGLLSLSQPSMVRLEWVPSKSQRVYKHIIRYNRIVYLMCSKKLTGSQLSLPRGINKKLKCETKNIMWYSSPYPWSCSVRWMPGWWTSLQRSVSVRRHFLLQVPHCPWWSSLQRWAPMYGTLEALRDNALYKYTLTYLLLIAACRWVSPIVPIHDIDDVLGCAKGGQWPV